MTATTAKKIFLLIFVFNIISAFTVLLMEGFEESYFEYTTPQANNQAENAGNAKKIIDRTTADFLPGACRTGGDGILFRRCGRLNNIWAGLDFFGNLC